MTINWKLFYKENDIYELQFAELMIRDGITTLRKGKAKSHGEMTEVDSFEAASDQLIQEGYLLQREWNYDRNNRDYDVFKNEVRNVILSDENFSITNALAIVTDSSYMTIGYVLEKFDDIESTDGENLWIVDTWYSFDSDWELLDPAYRWMLAYGWYDNLENDLYAGFYMELKKALQEILKSFSDTKDILLIYIGGDNIGHKLSAECMEEKLGKSMLKWVLGEE
jgi:hypothetical protein